MSTVLWIFCEILCLGAGTAGGSYVTARACRPIVKEYKERWRKAVELLHEDEKISDAQMDTLLGKSALEGEIYNGWRLETFTKNAKWTGGPHTGREFQGVCLRLVNITTGQVVMMNPSPDQIALDPGSPKFPEKMAAYKARVIESTKHL